MRHHLGIVLELSKVRIASMSVVTVLAGYVLAAGGVETSAINAAAGVFLLACGASALNQWQERDLDALMTRTAGRPLPSGRVTSRYVLATALTSLVLGSAALYPRWEAIVLGILTVFWYNGVYTPLKKITAFAAVPGGVVGALPPVIGWVCAGGDVFDPRIGAVAFFFFIWQIPHFWLLLMRTGEDYRRAGLPTLTAVFSRSQLSRVTFVWMLATAVIGLTLPLFGVTGSTWIYLGFIAASAWLAWHAVAMLRSGGTRMAFKQINVFALLVVSLLAISGLHG
jgi:protoheme IX farnesyltransferase